MRVHLTGLVAIGLLSCGTPTAPPPSLTLVPQWVPQSPDTAPFETGIRPWPDAALNGVGGIRLEWYALDPLQIGGYRLYRADTTDSAGIPINFRELATIEYGTTAEDTAFVDEAVTHWRTYYYRLHALDRSPQRREGPPSAIIHFTLEPPPIPLSPVGAVHPDSVVFRWSNNVGYVVLRVFEVDSTAPELPGRPVWVFAGPPRDYSNPRIPYNADGRAEPLQAGKLYRWRISRITVGRPDRGATSFWQTFWLRQ